MNVFSVNISSQGNKDHIYEERVMKKRKGQLLVPNNENTIQIWHFKSEMSKSESEC